MRERLLGGVLVSALVALQAGQGQATTIQFFDDFLGGASAGTPSSGVTFTSTTAVLPSYDDGIDYPGALFPMSGSMEVRVRIDQVGSSNAGGPGGMAPFSVLLDSKGALGRQPGDIFLYVWNDGRVYFTLNASNENPVSNPVHQLQSTSSILDGAFHTIGITFGEPAGMALEIDGVVVDTDPFTGPGAAIPFSLADYYDGPYYDPLYGSGFVGEVDWIRIQGETSGPPPPPTPEPLALSWLGLASLAAWRGLRRGPSRREQSGQSSPASGR